MTSTTADRLARLEARRRREELVLARHRRRARAGTINREFRLGATLDLVGAGPLDPVRLAAWLERAGTAARCPDLPREALHRRGEARLLEVAAAGEIADGGANGTTPSADRGFPIDGRIARGAMVVAAGLHELPRPVLIGLLVETFPHELHDLPSDAATDDGERIPCDRSRTS